tara:strand:- start:684 stop:956 length:273 start_codon:yes stop_codon:yes gene_type:complete
MNTYIVITMKCFFKQNFDMSLDLTNDETETMTKYKIEVPINKPLEKGIEDFLVMEMMKQIDKDPNRNVSEIINHHIDKSIFLSYQNTELK